MSIRILIIIFCIVPYTLLGQSLDSLQKELGKATTDAELKTDLLEKIFLLKKKAHSEDADLFLQDAIKSANQCKDKTRLGFLYYKVGNRLESIGKYDSAMNFIDMAQKFEDKSPKGISLSIWTRLLKGQILRRQSKYEDGVALLYEALKLAEQSQNDTMLQATYGSLGTHHVTIKDYDKAKQYHTTALDYALKLKDNAKIAKSYTNLGIIHREKKEHAENVKFVHKALEYTLNTKDSSNIAFVLSELGTAYSRNEQPEIGKKYLEQAMGIMERNQFETDLAYVYFYYGSALRGLNKGNESEMWIRKALAHAKKIKNTKQIIDCYQMMGINFEELRKPDSSLFYFKKFVKLRDSVQGATVKENIAELNIKYETQKKDIELKDAKIKNLYLISGLILSILGLLLGYGVYRRRKLQFQNTMQKKLMEEKEANTKAIVSAEENERTRIANELHDGVGQLITAAKMNLNYYTETRKDKDEHNDTLINVSKLIDDTAKEIRTISHNMSANALVKKGLTNALRAFLESYNTNQLRIQFETNGLNLPLDADTEIFLYRIIQECVNNVIKHANASQLSISISRDDKEIDVIIEDNGKGFHVAEAKKKDGIGLSNIEQRVKYLNGSIDWDSQVGRGTTITINIPI